ncbi:MAG: hypothetical protein P3W91_006510 [Fervidobacterium sp.]|nr:hypothetical protein [Fervidobacterium sp.]
MAELKMNSLVANPTSFAPFKSTQFQVEVYEWSGETYASNPTSLGYAMNVVVNEEVDVRRQFIIGSDSPQIVTGVKAYTIQISNMASPTFNAFKLAKNKQYIRIVVKDSDQTIAKYSNCLIQNYSLNANVGDVLVYDTVVVLCATKE